ncbi:MAG: VCBS repeat-containing protein [Thermoanaerobaculia bacterium]|nr:VCBS repeat-containing protein [Thermoanaerobaculia bacterium]
MRHRAAAIGILCLLFFGPMNLLADPSPRSRWSWTPLGYGIGERGFSALDIDGDGRAELFAAPRDQNYWYELRRDGLFRQTWSSFPEETELVALDVVGTPSGARLAVLYLHSLRIFDARSKVELLNIPTATGYNTDVALGDLDGDGVLDAVVCDEDTLYLFELANGTPTGLRHGFGCSDLKIGQIDDDSQLEIVIAGNPAGGYVLDGVSLAVEWGDLEGFGAQIALGDLDGDGHDEILAANDLYTAARALDPETDSELWRKELNGYPPDLFVADLDPAPGAEAIVHERYAALSILAGSTGALIRTPVLYVNTALRFAAADTDGDGDVELVWSHIDCCSGDDLWTLEGGSNVVLQAADAVPSLQGTFAVGKFGDASAQEVAVAVSSDQAGQEGVQVVVLDMPAGHQVRRSSFEPDINSPGVSSMIAMQTDAGAPAEICLGWRGGQGPVRCVDGLTFEEQWSGGTLGAIEVLASAELDGDATPELLAGTYGPAVEAHEGDSGWLKWRTPEVNPNFSTIDRVLAIDLDGDGIDDVLGRLSSYSNGVGQPVLFSGATGDLLSGPWDLTVWAMVKPALVENPANRVYVAMIDSTIRGLDPETGDTTQPLATLPGISRELAVVDLDRDGVLDFVVVDQFMYLRVVDGATATVAWQGPFLGSEGWGNTPALSLEAGDLDGNGVPDFAVATRYGLFFFEGPLFDLLIDGFESGDTLAWSGTVP